MNVRGGDDFNTYTHNDDLLGKENLIKQHADGSISVIAEEKYDVNPTMRNEDIRKTDFEFYLMSTGRN